jgi:hypothetical protein
MKISQRIAFTVAVLSSLAFSQAPAAQGNVAPDVSKTVNDVIRAHTGWEHITSAGVTIEAKETWRGELQGHPAVKYRIYVHGLSPKQLYDAYQWPINQREPQGILQGISIGKDGLLLCDGKGDDHCGESKTSDDPIDFVFVATAGEPFRFALMGPDKSRAALTLVPIPIAGSDGGCTISVQRLTPKFEIAYFTGTGFPPNSTMPMVSTSAKEEIKSTAKSDDQGKVRFGDLPFVKGLETGTTTVKINSEKCSPTVQFIWGK